MLWFFLFKQILFLYLLIKTTSYFQIYDPMIQTMWQKKIIFQINIQRQDVADDLQPLPLFLQMSWHHYVGVYYQQIQQFYSSWVLYPFQKDQFYLTLQSENIELNGTQIVGHLVTLYDVGIHNPVRLLCKFRNNNKKPTIQIKKLFKNTLKASASVRNRRFGASVLTVHMSIHNVQSMYQNYINDDFLRYLGSSNFQQDQKGYLFMISKSQKIPVKIIGRQFCIQRGIQKTSSLGRFIAQIFSEQVFSQQQKQQHAQQNREQTSNQLQQKQLGKQQQNTKEQTQNKQEQKISGADQGKNGDKRIKAELKYNYLFEKYQLYIHGIRVTRGQYPMSFFEKLCNPDGYLYIFYKEK